MCLLYLLTVTIILMYWYNAKETFTSQERASGINAWFNSHMNPSYTAYRRDLPDSNIVEYEGALGLYQAGKGTVSNIKKMILM